MRKEVERNWKEYLNSTGNCYVLEKGLRFSILYEIASFKETQKISFS